MTKSDIPLSRTKVLYNLLFLPPDTELNTDWSEVIVRQQSGAHSSFRNACENFMSTPLQEMFGERVRSFMFPRKPNMLFL